MSGDATDGSEGDVGSPLSWRRLVAADLSMLGRWLAEPRVARWWNHETSPDAVLRDFGPGLRGEEPGRTWSFCSMGDRWGCCSERGSTTT